MGYPNRKQPLWLCGLPRCCQCQRGVGAALPEGLQAQKKEQSPVIITGQKDHVSGKLLSPSNFSIYWWWRKQRRKRALTLSERSAEKLQTTQHLAHIFPGVTDLSMSTPRRTTATARAGSARSTDPWARRDFSFELLQPPFSALQLWLLWAPSKIFLNSPHLAFKCSARISIPSVS